MASRGKVRSAELSSSDKTATKKAKGVNTASVSDPPLSPENQSELIKELSKGVLDTIRASIQEVIRETIDRELSKAVDKLTKVFEERLSKLESTCRQLEEKVQEPRPTAGESDLQQQVLCLQHALHQEEHAANFVLSGVPEATNQGEENHSKTVIDVCKKELGLEISQSDLLEVRRLGRCLPAANTTTTRPQNRPRPILIKMISKSTKMKIVSRARETTQTTRHLFFNEDLTGTEQIRRKSLVPIYKELRARQVKCRLERGCLIIGDRMYFSAEEASQLVNQHPHGQASTNATLPPHNSRTPSPARRNLEASFAQVTASNDA